MLGGGLGIAYRTGTPAGAGPWFSAALFTGIVSGTAAIGCAVGFCTSVKTGPGASEAEPPGDG